MIHHIYGQNQLYFKEYYGIDFIRKNKEVFLFFQDIIVGFLNSLVLGTPATGVNEIQLKHRENWAGFATVRFLLLIFPIQLIIISLNSTYIVQHYSTLPIKQ